MGTNMDAWFKPAAASAEGESRSAIFDWLYGIKSEGKSAGNNILGKNPATTKFAVTNDGGEIDAITAATISSRAFLDAVTIAYKTYTNHTETNLSVTTETEGGEQ